jgi:hypothetical protein
VSRRKYGVPHARPNFKGILSLTPGFSQVQYEPKALKPVTARNIGLKSGVTKIVRNS